MAALVPLFPLGHVLLPGMPLPLHVFERRYCDLLDDVATPSGGYGSFGVVALRSGTEAESRWTVGPADGPSIESVGTVAEIVDLERTEDGSGDLLAVGGRRFRVLSLVGTDDPRSRRYAQAEVEYLAEDDGALTPQQQDRARELMGVYDSVLLRLAGRATGSGLPDDPAALAYQIAARLPLPPAERQQLLGADTTADRLGAVARFLRRELALLRATRSIAVAPSVLDLSAGIN